MYYNAIYSELRGKLKEKGIDQRYLAKKLGRSTAFVSTRLTGKDPWVQSDMYAIMDMLQLPHDELHIYFPPGGKKVKPKQESITEQEIELARALKTLMKAGIA